ncbi:MAG: hypothetical protein EBS23_09415, partial [Betaproteobacteria bacterium]|nr:hypothetical protein [Betaproteobacteria bacterium]
SGAFDVDAAVTLTRAIGAPSNAGNLSIAATNITLSRDVSTAGVQSYSGAVALGGTAGSSRVLTAGGTLDINGALSGSGIGLSVANASGDAIFRNSVSAASLSVSGNSILYGSVTTSGAQSYAGNLGVGANVNLDSAAGGVSILGAISGLSSLTPTLLYQTTSPSRLANGTVAYSSGYGLGASDAAALFTGNFSRITYRMELTRGSTINFAEASFDAWAGATVASLRIPDDAGDRDLVQQRIVNNLSVTSNVTGSAATALSSGGVISGSAKTGSLEIWSYNYSPATSSLLSSAGLQLGSGSTYDFDDTRNSNTNGHGSFQVHNLTDRQTIMAWNMHRPNGPAEIGFGNATSGHPDWTSTSTYGQEINANLAQWKLQISVNGGTPSLNINAGSGAVNIQGATSGLRSLDVSSSAASSSIVGIVSGATSLSKSGTGELQLQAANTYTGGTTVSGGTLKLGVTDALGSGAITVKAGSTLDLNGQSLSQSGQALSLSGIGTPVPGDTTGTSNPGALINSSASNASTVAGTITLKSPRDSSGTVIRVGEGAAIGGAGNITLSGAIAGTMGEANGLEKRGTGVLTLSAANSFSGSTIIKSGTLVVGNASGSALSSSSSVQVQSGATLDAGAGSAGRVVSVKSLAGAGSVLLQRDQVLNITNGLGTLDNTAAAFSGVISDRPLATGATAEPTGGLRISGGTLTLAGTNTYSGFTSILNRSTLVLTGSGNIDGSTPISPPASTSPASLGLARRSATFPRPHSTRLTSRVRPESEPLAA